MANETKTFSVIEYSGGFAVRHNATGKEQWMSDGVDVLFDEEGHPISPGTEGFREMWEDDLNSPGSEALEAYFPELVDKDDKVEFCDQCGRIGAFCICDAKD